MCVVARSADPVERIGFVRDCSLPPRCARAIRAQHGSTTDSLLTVPRVRAALGQRAGGRGRIAADPLVLPGMVELLGVAARTVDRGELAGDLLPVPGTAARHLVGADVHLPLRSGPAYPAVRARVLEREPLPGQIAGMAHVDDRVPLSPGVRLRLVDDRVD